MERYAVIVAGGKGERMNSDLPKQFITIGEQPILMHTITAFNDYDPSVKIILVLPKIQIALWNELCGKHNFSVLHSIVEGGNTRFQSVKNGLELVPEDSIVAIHDGVRPFVTKDTIDRCFTHATTHKTAIPVIELVDSIRIVDEDGNRSMNRANFRLVQTPQAFQSSLLKAAYEQPYSELFTDDASVVESFGEKVNLVDGNRENIKITTTYDLELSKFILQQKR